MFYKPYPKAIELVEKLRVELYERWLLGLRHYLSYNESNMERYEEIKDKIPCTVKWMDEFNYPVLFVEYPGMMPHYDEYMKMRGKVRDIYQHAFNLANLHVPRKHVYEQAHVFIVHYFQNRIIRDLDNRYTNFIINNLRYGGYVPDDDWQHVWLTEMGLLGEEEKVQMYVVEVNNSADFYSDYLMKLRDRALTTNESEDQNDETSYEEHMSNLDLGKPDKNYDDDTTSRKRNPKLRDWMF